MTISRNRALRTGLATAGAAAAFAVALPATASADLVDDALARVPAGQISCAQANEYWTNEAQYDAIRSYAQTVAVSDPRGAEINDALARIDEAAHRCGLKDGGTPPGPAPSPSPGNGGAPVHNGGGDPAPAPDNGPVFTVPAPQGTPTVSVPVADLATVVVPDVGAIVDDAASRLGGGSAMPFAELTDIELPAGSSR